MASVEVEVKDEDEDEDEDETDDWPDIKLVKNAQEIDE